MSPPLPESLTPFDYATFVKNVAEAAEAHGRSESHVDDMATLMARLAPQAEKASPWIEWLRSSILPVVLLAVSGIGLYYHDQASIADRMADMSRNLESVSQRLERDERDTADRVKDLVPIIRGNDMAQKQSELIDRQQNDRIEATAQSILQLRQTVETLSEAVSKTHEDLMIDRARRGEKESRMTVPDK